MDQRKTFAEMLGEAFRDIAILVIVFTPLDVLTIGDSFTWNWFWATVGISVPLFAMGVILEKIRRPVYYV